MKVLWLASWYPDPYEPSNGDFIRRHAQAVSKYIPVDVIHLVQVGKDTQTKDECIYTESGNLREWVYSFHFKKWGVSWVDKLRYHIQYRKQYKKILLEYVGAHGKPSLIHVHVPMKAGLVARSIASAWKIPYIVSEQASHYEKDAPDHFLARSFFFRQNTAKIFKDAAFVTNVSATIGKTLKDTFHLKKVETVHNLADTDFFNFKPGLAPTTFRWIHVSSLHQQKNVEEIIKAFKQLDSVNKNWELVIVGPDPLSLQQLVNEFHLSHKISFTGELPYHEVAEQMQRSSAFVLFSNHENFPCVIPEALYCGLPVVSSLAGGVAEAIDESNGILVRKGDINGLTTVLNRLMNQYKNYDRLKISSEAASRYSAEQIGKQFVEIYEGIERGQMTS